MSIFNHTMTKYDMPFRTYLDLLHLNVQENNISLPVETMR